VKPHRGQTTAPRFTQRRIGFNQENRSLLSHGVLGKPKERWIGSTLEPAGRASRSERQ
jgi:hypothetical protein